MTAANIAHSARALGETPAIGQIVDIPLIASLAQSMVRKSLDALVAADRTACYHQLVTFMRKDPRNVSSGLSLLAVTRTIERLADHATNIAEDVLFLVKGVDVRHHLGALLFNERITE